jgi:hypothetical protein
MKIKNEKWEDRVVLVQRFPSVGSALEPENFLTFFFHDDRQ